MRPILTVTAVGVMTLAFAGAALFLDDSESQVSVPARELRGPGLPIPAKPAQEHPTPHGVPERAESPVSLPTQEPEPPALAGVPHSASQDENGELVRRLTTKMLELLQSGNKGAGGPDSAEWCARWQRLLIEAEDLLGRPYLVKADRPPQEWGANPRALLLARGIQGLAYGLEGRADAGAAELASDVGRIVTRLLGSDPDPYVRKQAWKTMGILELPLDHPSWQECRERAIRTLTTDTDYRDQEGAASACRRLTLGNARDEPLAKALATHLESEDNLARNLGIEFGQLQILGGMGRSNPEARESLARIARTSPRERVQEAALEALQVSLARSHPRFVFEVASTIVADGSKSTGVRWIALTLLRKVASREEIERILGELRAAEPQGSFRDLFMGAQSEPEADHQPR